MLNLGLVRREGPSTSGGVPLCDQMPDLCFRMHNLAHHLASLGECRVDADEQRFVAVVVHEVEVFAYMSSNDFHTS